MSSTENNIKVKIRQRGTEEGAYSTLLLVVFLGQV